MDLAYLKSIAAQVAQLRRRQIEVTIISSGAINEGCTEMGISRRPKDVADLQAIAAVGQPRLMLHMQRAFARYKLTTAQLLLTRGDFDDRVRFLNIRNCVNHLHRQGCVPIINENDTVAVEELEAMRFGENDVLAAMICNALRADTLVLLTVVDGLQDSRRRRIDLVENIHEVMSMVRASKSRLGKGGMGTKVQAARLVSDAGELAVIAHGREPNVLPRLFDGEAIGTVFAPASRKLDSRSRWIGLTKQPAGTIEIDQGATTALTERGKSLLASGIVGLTGQFTRGDVVMVRSARGREIARGLTNYPADELRLIKGHRSTQFEKILGRPAFAEVVHRDNLVITDVDSPGK